MILHTGITNIALREKIKSKTICFAGNKRLRIYGTLRCASGKRMKKEHRVFFTSAEAAMQAGYRPCGHCLSPEYKQWKNGLV